MCYSAFVEIVMATALSKVMEFFCFEMKNVRHHCDILLTNLIT